MYEHNECCVIWVVNLNTHSDMWCYWPVKTAKYSSGDAIASVEYAILNSALWATRNEDKGVI